MKNCLNCGKINRSKYGKKYCSVECGRMFAKEHPHLAYPNIKEKALLRQHKYEENPDACQQCLKILPYRHSGDFCSRSCGAKFHNARRLPLDPARQQKINEDRRKRMELRSINKPAKIPKQIDCKVCGAAFEVAPSSNRKICGDGCRHTHASKTRIEYLKSNAGSFSWISSRGTPSYFEQSFCTWLDEQNICYLPQHHIFNEELNTSYFLDVFIPGLSLNIELDGTHHERDLQSLRDQKRDEFLKRQNITVHRISIRDYNKANNRQVCWDTCLDLIRTLQRNRTSMCPVTLSTP